MRYACPEEIKEIRIFGIRLEPTTFRLAYWMLYQCDTRDRCEVIRLTTSMATNVQHTASTKMMNVMLLHNDDVNEDGRC